MSQPTNPNQPLDPYERYRVEAIEKDKKEKASHPRRQDQSAFGALLLSLLRKLLDVFQQPSEQGLTSTAEKEIKRTLSLFRESLETLKREDRSQDGAFLNQIADQWHWILEEALKFRKNSSLANQYVAFIKEIESYPEKAEHTLGYYLMEYAGQKWLPFPFIELLQKLHLDHQKNPSISHLTRWTTQISSLVTALSEN